MAVEIVDFPITNGDFSIVTLQITKGYLSIGAVGIHTRSRGVFLLPGALVTLDIPMGAEGVC